MPNTNTDWMLTTQELAAMEHLACKRSPLERLWHYSEFLALQCPGKAMADYLVQSPYMVRVDAWALRQDGLPLNDKRAVLLAYLAADDHLRDHAEHFWSELVKAGLVKVDGSRESAGWMLERMHYHLLQTP